jgi:hypothetical protein
VRRIFVEKQMESSTPFIKRITVSKISAAKMVDAPGKREQFLIPTDLSVSGIVRFDFCNRRNEFGYLSRLARLIGAITARSSRPLSVFCN